METFEIGEKQMVRIRRDEGTPEGTPVVEAGEWRLGGLTFLCDALIGEVQGEPIRCRYLNGHDGGHEPRIVDRGFLEDTPLLPVVDDVFLTGDMFQIQWAMGDAPADDDEVEQTYGCYLCNLVFNTENGLEHHIANTHPEPLMVQRLVCPVCMARMPDFRTLQLHQAGHMIDDLGTAVGDGFGLLAPELGDATVAVVDVIQGMNGGPGWHRCDVCDELHDGVGGFLEHFLERHTAYAAAIRRYLCHPCRLSFADSDAVGFHAANEHLVRNVVGPAAAFYLNCPRAGCGFATNDTEQMALHMDLEGRYAERDPTDVGRPQTFNDVAPAPMKPQDFGQPLFARNSRRKRLERLERFREGQLVRIVEWGTQEGPDAALGEVGYVHRVRGDGTVEVNVAGIRRPVTVHLDDWLVETVEGG